MMLAMAMMFIANVANAANFSASSQSIEADAVNESDYDISMDSSLTLQVNETFTLTPVIIPATAQTSLSWYSEDDLVARVSDFGVVTALTVGTTEVVARAANGKKVKCTVTVTSAMSPEAFNHTMPRGLLPRQLKVLGCLDHLSCTLKKHL